MAKKAQVRSSQVAQPRNQIRQQVHEAARGFAQRVLHILGRNATLDDLAEMRRTEPRWSVAVDGYADDQGLRGR